MSKNKNIAAKIFDERQQFKHKFNTLLLNTLRNLHPHREEWVKRLIYPLSVGGKRMRSLLLFTIGRLLQCPINALEDLCCVVELVHTYSLVHDDLPCMDDDCFRRGFPTTHKMFGEADAILVGNALLTEAFYLLSHTDSIPPLPKINLLQALSFTLGSQEMLYGQWIDINNLTTDLDSLVELHQKKTGALFALALSAPAVLLQKDALAEQLKKTGLKLGLAFQIQDDLLDVSTSPFLGKTAGKDQKLQKKTFFNLLGQDKSQELLSKLYFDIKTELKSIFPASPALDDLLEQLEFRSY